MASNASSSSSTAASESEPTEVRPQAGPLPRKRGEIGFRESVHREEEECSSEGDSIPARHPADRGSLPTTPAAPSSEVPSASSISSTSSPAPSVISSTRKSPKNKLLSFFGAHTKFTKKTFGGVALTTILRLFFQLTLLGGTLGAWILITNKLSSSNNNSPPSDTSSDSQNVAATFGGSASIFVHVTFGIAMLGQLLFLERCIFYIRAQRYAYLHPGSVLPSHGQPNSRGGLGMGFAPWNRPSLPTYAAALAQSGVGTGDVEDNAIAIPPPPAYGNTRGSTLILAGFLRNSLREAITRGDRLGALEEGDQRPVSRASRPDRPVSYRSHDEEWEERCDAERSLRLAETLERLEEGSNANNQSGTRSTERT